MRERAFTCCMAAIRNALRCCWREGRKEPERILCRKEEVMKMENPLEPAGRAALAASREMLALEPEEKAQALRLMAAGVRNAAEKIIRENVLDM